MVVSEMRDPLKSAFNEKIRRAGVGILEMERPLPKKKA